MTRIDTEGYTERDLSTPLMFVAADNQMKPTVTYGETQAIHWPVVGIQNPNVRKAGVPDNEATFAVLPDSYTKKWFTEAMTTNSYPDSKAS